MDSTLAGLTLVVTDLPGAQLADSAGSVIYVDSNAAGYGWFVDASPLADSEFSGLGSERYASATSSAYGYVDLLTVLEHELGHQLGLDHNASPGNVMNDTLGLSTRRLPTAWDAALAMVLWESGQQRK